MWFLQISFLLAFSTLFLFRSHLYFITTTLGSFNWSLSLLSYPLLYLHRLYRYFHVFFPSLMMPRHLASMCESCEKSSSLSPGNHENLQSYSFPPLLRNSSSIIRGKKSLSTVKTIHNLVLPYLLNTLIISPVFHFSQTELTVLWLHEFTFIFITSYFFTFSSLCLKCLSPSEICGHS